MIYLYDACDQISDFCHQQLLRKMRRKISWTTDGQTDRGKTVFPPPPSGSWGIMIKNLCLSCYIILNKFWKMKTKTCKFIFYGYIKEHTFLTIIIICPILPFKKCPKLPWINLLIKSNFFGKKKII